MSSVVVTKIYDLVWKSISKGTVLLVRANLVFHRSFCALSVNRILLYLHADSGKPFHPKAMTVLMVSNLTLIFVFGVEAPAGATFWSLTIYGKAVHTALILRFTFFFVTA